MATAQQNNSVEMSARGIAVIGLGLCVLALSGTWEKSTLSVHIFRVDHTTEFVDQDDNHRGWSIFDTTHHFWSGDGAANGLTTSFAPGTALRLAGLLIGFLAAFVPGSRRGVYYLAAALLFGGWLFSGAELLAAPCVFGLGILIVFVSARRRSQEEAE